MTKWNGYEFGYLLHMKKDPNSKTHRFYDAYINGADI